MTTTMTITSVVIPIHNEAESLPTLLDELDRVFAGGSLGPAEYVLVDDGSRDDSWSVIKRLTQENPRVRAIRLQPVDDNKMFGRDGILAHTYMLGPNGQSNGCVSFRDYSKFLTAFMRGEVDRLVVVAHLGNTPARAADRARRGQYASNYE